MDEKDTREILEQLKQINILTRVNNLLLSKFVLQLQVVRKELHLPKLKGFFRFELLEEEYVELVKEFNKEDVNKALYKLDRQLSENKLNCPHNIKKYIKGKLKNAYHSRDMRAREKEKQKKSRE